MFLLVGKISCLCRKTTSWRTQIFHNGKWMFTLPAKAYRRRKKYKTQIWVNFGGLINNKVREIVESFLNSLIVLMWTPYMQQYWGVCKCIPGPNPDITFLHFFPDQRAMRVKTRSRTSSTWISMELPKWAWSEPDSWRKWGLIWVSKWASYEPDASWNSWCMRM